MYENTLYHYHLAVVHLIILCINTELIITFEKTMAMKFFILAVLTFFLFAFTLISKKNIPSPKITVPPGTSLIVDSLYMDKYEISNMAWQEFIRWVQTYDKDTLKYKKLAADTIVWYSLKYDADRYINTYFSSVSFAGYPVVGISYEQAKEFCEWRTARVNELLQKMPGSAFKRVEYKLPTEKEWELAAAGKLDTAMFPYGYEHIKERIRGGDTVKMFNCYYADFDSLSPQQANTKPVNSGKPNQYGIYNMIGNVAEMVSEEGLAKGGFYDLPLEYCKIKEQSSYKFPNRYLGFRCACIIDNTFFAKPPKESFKKEKTEKPEVAEKKPQTKKEKKKKNSGFEEEQ
jgi:hypothetical protein